MSETTTDHLFADIKIIGQLKARRIGIDRIFMAVQTNDPVFLDWHIFDIPETLKKAIYNAPDNVCAISFNASLSEGVKDKVNYWCSNVNVIPFWWEPLSANKLDGG